MMGFVKLFYMLLIGHALADYPLQGDWIARAKNPNVNVVPGETIWPGVMACHAAIHAGFVWLFTGSFLLGCCEFNAHFIIDYCKCQQLFSYNTDQLLHVLCKLVWTVLALTVIGLP